jgi:hypothetical protein
MLMISRSEIAQKSFKKPSDRLFFSIVYAFVERCERRVFAHRFKA